jgi:hypothetical protein
MPDALRSATANQAPPTEVRIVPPFARAPATKALPAALVAWTDSRFKVSTNILHSMESVKMKTHVLIHFITVNLFSYRIDRRPTVEQPVARLRRASSCPLLDGEHADQPRVLPLVFTSRRR